ncbi:hypothetical protein Ac2012v2_002715 [Leucoagaricus gongylophorus]
MQSYLDNPFNDPASNYDSRTATHQYTHGTSQGYSAIPLHSQADYRNVAPPDLGSAGDQRFVNSQWDGSRYNQGSAWINEQKKQTHRTKIVVITGVLILVIIVVASVSVGVVVSRRNSSTPNPSSSSSNLTNPGAVSQTDPNDPSTFVKSPNLHQAFYGIAYTPMGSQLPDCGNNLAAVIQDIQLLSQLTKRVRLYGADCNQSALVLEAIRQTKVDVTVYLGNYVVPTDGGASYNRQKDIIEQAIQVYGADHIGGITVGNEFMLNYLTANSVSDPNSVVGNEGAQLLIPNITDTVSMLNSMILKQHIPVGNADAGGFFNNEVLQAVEYGMANVHPWFANVSIDAAASWTTTFFQQNDVDAASSQPNKPSMSIAETGWPTKSSDAESASDGPSVASVANLQTFIDTFVCQANSAGTQYFFFEFADEDWKDKQFGGVEGWWGLFNHNRTLKEGITIPTCQAP